MHICENIHIHKKIILTPYPSPRYSLQGPATGFFRAALGIGIYYIYLSIYLSICICMHA